VEIIDRRSRCLPELRVQSCTHIWYEYIDDAKTRDASSYIVGWAAAARI